MTFSVMLAHIDFLTRNIWETMEFSGIYLHRVVIHERGSVLKENCENMQVFYELLC